MMELNRSNISGSDKNGTPIKGNPSQFYGIGIVAFVDLLGFSNSVISEWGDGEQSPLAKLLRIKSMPLIKEQLAVSIGSYHVGQNGETIHDDIYRIKVHTLSDSIALSVALPSEQTIGDFVLAFSSIAVNLRFVWQAALDEGYIVRGAAEIDHIFWNESELVGPALAKAYSLERTRSKTARIILGPNLLSALARVSERDVYDWTSFTARNSDGLISFNPQIHLTRTSDLVRLRNKVADDHRKVSKYRDLIDANDRPVESPVPSIADIHCAATKIASTIS